MRVLLVAAFVLVAALAGCADRDDAISAKEGLGPARDAARAHGDDPVLVGVASVEPLKHMAGEGYEVWVHLDKNPGDGRAPGWMYTFTSGDRFIGVVYAAGLGVVAEGYEVAHEQEWDTEWIGLPIEDWRIDSTQAASILAGLDDWPAARDDTTAFWALMQTKSGPVWSVEWANATSTMGATVDARTGNVSHVEQFVMEAVVGPCAEAISPGGSITPLEEQSLHIDVPAGGRLGYGYAWSMTLGEAEMTIEGPEGQVGQDTLSATGQGMGSMDGLAGGTYTLRIAADAGVGEASRITMSSC